MSISISFVSSTSLACIGTTGPTGEDGTEWDVPCQDDPGAGIAPVTPDPPPPTLPPIVDPTPPSEPEPSDPSPDEPTPRQECLQSNLGVEQDFTQCRALASARHTTDLRDICAGGGTVQFGASIEAGNLIITGGSFTSITIDEYMQCKDVRDSQRTQAYDSCAVIRQRAIRVCPGD